MWSLVFDILFPGFGLVEPLTENPAQSANERPEDSIYAVQPGKTSDYSSQGMSCLRRFIKAFL